VEILLATGNRKKMAELRGLLAPLGVDLLAPSDVGGLPDVEETESTFAGNARKKARAAARAAGRWSLADDSGLEVDALGGLPGVRSARFAGAHGDDAANNRLLLEQLAGIAPERRSARFVCAIALADPLGEIDFEAQGTARGRILEAERGTRDFGYDPLFLFTEEGHASCGRSFAELDAEEKAAVSHRGRALRQLVQHLSQRIRA
jgi:XTP/dITP diphosphohydrolase